jgi:hypothetical protein
VVCFWLNEFKLVWDIIVNIRKINAECAKIIVML